MKQARFWLLLAGMATAMLLPQAAFAQPKKPGGKPPAAAPAKPPATAPPAAGAGGDIGDIDAPPPGGDAPGTPPGGDTGTGTPPATGSGGGICEIDPSACPKPGDIQAAANKTVKADVYAVQQIYALRRGRFELMPYWSFSLNDQFVGHGGPGLGVNYYLPTVLALGLNGTFHQPFNSDSDFNFQNRRATRLAVPLNEYQAAATVNFTYVPMYGNSRASSSSSSTTTATSSVASARSARVPSPSSTRTTGSSTTTGASRCRSASASASSSTAGSR